MVAGAAMAIQGTMNSVLGKVIGLWESTLVVHVVGLITVAAVIICAGVGFQGLAKVNQAPWYVYAGGILNVLIIFGVVKSMPKIGVGNATTGIIFAQILTAVLIDRFGLMGVEKVPFRWVDLLGVVLLAVGTRVLLK
ncbi:MAG: DMT family transporter [Syntrophomonadaceae bacterium]|nr:DMT family transporter [Syntrophomonadaceae bacterium]